MTRKVAVVEEPNAIKILENVNPEDDFVYFTKGFEWARAEFTEDDAKEYSDFDIVIVQKNRKKAEELRKLILKNTDRENIVLVRYLYDGHILQSGDFQVIRLNESFYMADTKNAEHPWLEGYKIASQMLDAPSQKR